MFMWSENAWCGSEWGVSVCFVYQGIRRSRNVAVTFPWQVKYVIDFQCSCFLERISPPGNQRRRGCGPWNQVRTTIASGFVVWCRNSPQRLPWPMSSHLSEAHVLRRPDRCWPFAPWAIRLAQRDAETSGSGRAEGKTDRVREEGGMGL